MKSIAMKEILKIMGIVIVLTIVLIGFCLYAINNQKQRTVKEMSNKILSSAEYYAISLIMTNNVHEVIINFPDSDILEIKGSIPQNGYLKITTAGEIEMLFHYNGYCINKNLDDSDSTFTKTSAKECLNN